MKQNGREIIKLIKMCKNSEIDLNTYSNKRLRYHLVVKQQLIKKMYKHLCSTKHKCITEDSLKYHLKQKNMSPVCDYTEMAKQINGSNKLKIELSFL